MATTSGVHNLKFIAANQNSLILLDDADFGVRKAVPESLPSEVAPQPREKVEALFRQQRNALVRESFIDTLNRAHS